MKRQILENRDIVLFGFQLWDEDIGSNFKDIALELAKNNRVIFINRALDRGTAILSRNDRKVRSRLRSVHKGEGELIEVQRNLWVHNPRTIVESINWLPRGSAYNYLNLLNTRRIAQEINKVIRQLNFKDIILINDNDFFRGVHLRKFLDCSVYAFYIRDYLTFQPWFRKHGKNIEPKMLQVADIVVANSGYLANYAKRYNSRSYDIGQGCDVHSYLIDVAQLPADLKNIPKPIIGYAGAISGARLDAITLACIAEQFPDCSLVLVGPVTDGFNADSLKKFSNVYFLGRKDPKDIPDYVFHFDICINPQQVNQLTIGNYPRKADEYLAMGKPMVATRTDAMEMFADFVFLCTSKEEYVIHIQEILKNPNLRNGSIRKQRQEFALSHTWENSVGKLGQILHEFELKQGKYAKLGQA